ncbi:kinase-like domain-containing protein [Pelagophyceae sp. CCMP2097]|nr:kinase-like domain-containing protein [Pelagophyceae sp. CCMP2097]
MFEGLEAQYLIPFSLLKMGSLVAAGGSGQVYRGKYAGARVAIKSLFSQMMDPDYVAEVRHEARMLAAVRHPHITMFHGISRFENRLLLVTEFVDLSLDGLVSNARGKHDAVLRKLAGRKRAQTTPNATASDGAFAQPPEEASTPGNPERPQHSDMPRPVRFSVEDGRRILVELAQTMIYLHSSGLAHRDIKPSNMLLAQGHDGRYHLKLCDLGMARFSSSRRNHFVTLGSGTPAYSPPESYRPAPVSGEGFEPRSFSGREPRSPSAEIEDLTKWDVFSSATVAWFVWHLQDPFPGLSVPDVCVAVCRGERPKFGDAPAGLKTLCADMWHQEASKRPTAAGVLEGLQREDLVKDTLLIAYKQANNLPPYAYPPPPTPMRPNDGANVV